MRSPDTITSELVATGLTPVQTTLLFELTLSLSSDSVRRIPVESPEEIAARKRREYDRERKRRKRLLAVEGAAELPAESPADKADIPCVLEEVKGSSEEGLVKKDKKGTRMREGAPLSDADRTFAETLLPAATIDQHWVEFVDYWIGVPGARGVKTNWPATWRNRVRDIAKRSGDRGGNRARNTSTNPSAGPATARENAFLTRLGNGALRVLNNSAAARQPGEFPGGADAAGAAVADTGTKERH